MLSENERFERELFIKRRVIDEFEAKKKMEMVVLKEKLKVQKLTLTYQEMTIEDLSSEISRWYENNTSLSEKLDNLTD